MSAKVAVCFLTYTPRMDHPRVQYAQHCLYALTKNLHYRGGEFIWHIADDGSPPEHVEKLKEIIMRNVGVEPTISVTDHEGYGANMNHATQVLHPLVDIVMPLEEDWELMHEFDISGLVRALEEGEQDFPDENHISCIRLGYLGWTETLSGHLVQKAAQTFFRFSKDSTENHVFAGHPRIETVAFEKRVGPWPEGMRAGYTEMEVCHREAARTGIAWPLDAGVNASQDYCSLFAHVGEVQGG